MVAVVFEFLYVIFVYLSAVILIILIARYYRGMKTPIFWIYFLAGFFLLTVQNFFAVSLQPTELNISFVSFVKLIASIMVFMGVFELYRTLRKK